MLNEKATRASEFVRLTRNDTDGQLLTRQVGAGQFERFGRVGLLDVCHRRLRRVAAGAQDIERLILAFDLGRS